LIDWSSNPQGDRLLGGTSERPEGSVQQEDLEEWREEFDAHLESQISRAEGLEEVGCFEQGVGCCCWHLGE